MEGYEIADINPSSNQDEVEYSLLMSYMQSNEGQEQERQRQQQEQQQQLLLLQQQQHQQQKHLGESDPQSPIVPLNLAASFRHDNIDGNTSASDSEQKSFACPQCNKVFNKKTNLKVHSRKHTGEKPFQCKVATCGKRFMWKSSLTFHENNCHKDLEGVLGSGVNSPMGPMGGADPLSAVHAMVAANNVSSPSTAPSTPKGSRQRKPRSTISKTRLGALEPSSFTSTFGPRGAVIRQNSLIKNSSFGAIIADANMYRTSSVNGPKNMQPLNVTNHRLANLDFPMDTDEDTDDSSASNVHSLPDTSNMPRRNNQSLNRKLHKREIMLKQLQTAIQESNSPLRTPVYQLDNLNLDQGIASPQLVEQPNPRDLAMELSNALFEHAQDPNGNDYDNDNSNDIVDVSGLFSVENFRQEMDQPRQFHLKQEDEFDTFSLPDTLGKQGSFQFRPNISKQSVNVNENVDRTREYVKLQQRQMLEKKNRNNLLSPRSKPKQEEDLVAPPSPLMSHKPISAFPKDSFKANNTFDSPLMRSIRLQKSKLEPALKLNNSNVQLLQEQIRLQKQQLHEQQLELLRQQEQQNLRHQQFLQHQQQFLRQYHGGNGGGSMDLQPSQAQAQTLAQVQVQTHSHAQAAQTQAEQFRLAQAQAQSQAQSQSQSQSQAQQQTVKFDSAQLDFLNPSSFLHEGMHEKFMADFQNLQNNYQFVQRQQQQQQQLEQQQAREQPNEFNLSNSLQDDMTGNFMNPFYSFEENEF